MENEFVSSTCPVAQRGCNTMTDKDLSQSVGGSALLTNPSDPDRLPAMMARWWDGWSLTRIGHQYGISRQRVAALLAQVGCTRALWRKADRRTPDSRRTAPAGRVAAARQALRHPLAGDLTVRQRAALAWQSQGLVLSDIARRMATSPQNVRRHQVAGLWRLERWSIPKVRRKNTTSRSVRLPLPAPRPPDDDETPDLNWNGLLPGPGQPETKHVGPRRDVAGDVGRTCGRIAHLATGAKVGGHGATNWPSQWPQWRTKP